MDDGGIDGGELVVGEAQRGHVTDRRILDERIRAPYQIEQPLAAFVGGQICRNALLALVIGPVGQRALRIRLVVNERAGVTAVDPAGRLDGNHLCAQAGEQVAAELADALAEIQYPVVLQHLELHPSSAPAQCTAWG